jgi:acetyl-CoA synthetase
MQHGDEWVTKHDRSSLRVLGTAGEPINPHAWLWYRDVVGEGRCPIIDTWWQTETGAPMITPLPYAWPLKPGSATVRARCFVCLRGGGYLFCCFQGGECSSSPFPST